MYLYEKEQHNFLHDRGFFKIRVVIVCTTGARTELVFFSVLLHQMMLKRNIRVFSKDVDGHLNTPLVKRFIVDMIKAM